MKIALLTRNKKLYSHQRIIEVATQRLGELWNLLEELL